MAPKSTKAKVLKEIQQPLHRVDIVTKIKNTEVKVAETDVPKKGRGKAKVAIEQETETEIEVEESALPATKTKRGKKAANDVIEPVNNKSEESAPPAKRGRKKIAQDTEPIPTANGDQVAEDESAKDDQNEENIEANGDTEVPSTGGRGRKKQQAKKEPAPEKIEKPSRGRRNKQEAEITEKEEPTKEVIEVKPKGKGRGRKAQPKAESEMEKIETVDEVATEKPVTKGRRKAQTKVTDTEDKVDETEHEPEDDQLEKEDKPVEAKTAKGRKGRKAATKEDEAHDIEKDESSSKKKKGPKKEDKPKETETKDEEDLDEDIPDEKPAKAKRGQKKEDTAAVAEGDGSPHSSASEPAAKRRRRPADDNVPEEEPKKKAPPKNKSVTNYEDIDLSNASKNENSKEWNLKISSWNVDGIRAWASKGGLDYLKHEKPDILCLQETKCSKDKLPEEVANVPGYHAYWLAGDKEGYAGVAIYTTKLAMNVQYGLQNVELDGEGRIITAEYEQFYLVCTYVPNAGRKLVTLPKRLQWNEGFRKYIKELDKKKPVIICGDMNVSHNEIDLANPKTNRKNAGFTDEERAGMTELLGAGFVDSFRRLYPDTPAAYTFWTYMSNSRAKNVGWRLDYFIISERLVPSLCDNVIRSQVYGSDHCPITLFLHITSADKPKEE